MTANDNLFESDVTDGGSLAAEVQTLMSTMKWSDPAVGKEKQAVMHALAGLCGVSLDAVKVYHVSKPANLMVRLTQQGAAGGKAQLGVLGVKDRAHLSKTAEKARAAMGEEPVGTLFKHLFLFSPDERGRWVARTLIGPQDSTTERLLAEFKDVDFEEVGSAGAVVPSTVRRTVWIEFTKSKNKPDQDGWRLGECAWSPERDRKGNDRYSSMRDVEEGDLVVHVSDREIKGWSRAPEPVKTSREEPPLPGEWGGHELYYVLRLSDYRDFQVPVSLQHFLDRNKTLIREELQDPPPHYPFNESGKGPLQAKLGGYLYRCTPRTVALLMKELPEFLPDEVGGFTAPGDLFITDEEYEEFLDLLRTHKNLVLCGPPGVGKTFVAKQLVEGLIGTIDPTRFVTVQFHESFSYEDFIRGFRPTESGFELRDGSFVRICRQAAEKPDKAHVVLIDEINRANLGKVFGELMLLIEADKRGRAWSASLVYERAGELPFFVPENVYVIGTMNTADRSLAMVDYALRRRFCFAHVPSAIGAPKFGEHLVKSGVSAEMVERIQSRVTGINDRIAADVDLGLDYVVGHSFFCTDVGPAGEEQWYRRIVTYQLLPLLGEYWFDDQRSLEDARALLLPEG